MTKQKIGLGIGLALLAFTAAFIGGKVASSSPVLGGSMYEAIPKWFGNGLSAGLTEQLSVDNAGNLTTTGTLTAATTTTNAVVSWSPGALATSTMGTATTLNQND